MSKTQLTTTSKGPLSFSSKSLIRILTIDDQQANNFHNYRTMATGITLGALMSVSSILVCTFPLNGFCYTNSANAESDMNESERSQ
jgi:hypothetical protein